MLKSYSLLLSWNLEGFLSDLIFYLFIFGSYHCLQRSDFASSADRTSREIDNTWVAYWVESSKSLHFSKLLCFLKNRFGFDCRKQKMHPGCSHAHWYSPPNIPVLLSLEYCLRCLREDPLTLTSRICYKPATVQYTRISYLASIINFIIAPIW